MTVQFTEKREGYALLKDDDNNDVWVEELKQPGSDGDGENNQTDRGS